MRVDEPKEGRRCYFTDKKMAAEAAIDEGV